MNKAQSVSSCPFCHSLEILLTLNRSEQHIAEGLCLYTCSNCGLTFLNPRLSIEAIESLEDISDIYHFTSEELQQEISIREAMVARLEQMTQKKGRLLDVGCNRGLLLEAARRRGWVTAGVELSSHAANLARTDFNLEVYQSFEPVWELEPFDLIIAWHVLEHTLHPRAFLRQISGLLAKDGILAIQVPSFSFVDEFERRGIAGSLLCSVHNFYFTPQSLDMVLRSAGLELLLVDNNSDSLMLTAICCKQSSDYTDRHSQVVINDSGLIEAYNRHLEQAIAQKNAHIAKLEALIDQFEQGRIMRGLRWLNKLRG